MYKTMLGAALIGLALLTSGCKQQGEKTGRTGQQQTSGTQQYGGLGARDAGAGIGGTGEPGGAQGGGVGGSGGVSGGRDGGAPGGGTRDGGIR